MNMKFPKMSRPVILYSVLFVAGAVILLFVATAPLRDLIVAENEGIQKFYAKTENDQRKISHLSEFHDQSIAIAKDEAKLQLLLPEGRIVDFIRELENAAKLTGGTVVISKGGNLEESRKAASVVAASAIKTADGAADNRQKGMGLLKKLPDGKTLGLTLTFSGKYSDSVNFLHKIETAPYFLNVLSLDIRPIVLSQDSGAIRSDVFATPIGRVKAVNPAVPATVEDTVKAEFDIIVYLQ